MFVLYEYGLRRVNAQTNPIREKIARLLLLEKFVNVTFCFREHRNTMMSPGPLYFRCTGSCDSDRELLQGTP